MDVPMLLEITLILLTAAMLGGVVGWAIAGGGAAEETDERVAYLTQELGELRVQAARLRSTVNERDLALEVLKGNGEESGELNGVRKEVSALRKEHQFAVRALAKQSQAVERLKGDLNRLRARVQEEAKVEVSSEFKLSRFVDVGAEEAFEPTLPQFLGAMIAEIDALESEMPGPRKPDSVPKTDALAGAPHTTVKLNPGVKRRVGQVPPPLKGVGGAGGEKVGLEAIEGIGPTMVARLRANDVKSLEQVAAMRPADLKILAALIGLDEGQLIAQDWPGQAQRLLGKT